MHPIRKLSSDDDIKLSPEKIEAITKDVKQKLAAIKGPLLENEKFLSEYVPGASFMQEENLDGMTFSGERIFPLASLTKEQDEDIILLNAWKDIKPMNSLSSIDEYVPLYFQIFLQTLHLYFDILFIGNHMD